MLTFDASDIALYVLFALAATLGGGLLSLIGYLLKTQAHKWFDLLSSVEQLADPKTGAQATISQELAHLRTQIFETTTALCKDTEELKNGMNQLRTNGHMFADRVSNIERRVQQGAEELNDIRREVRKDGC